MHAAPTARRHASCWVRAEEAREHLPETLRAAGAAVTVAPAYRNVMPAGSAGACARDLWCEAAGGCRDLYQRVHGPQPVHHAGKPPAALSRPAWPAPPSVPSPQPLYTTSATPPHVQSPQTTVGISRHEPCQVSERRAASVSSCTRTIYSRQETCIAILSP